VIKTLQPEHTLVAAVEACFFLFCTGVTLLEDLMTLRCDFACVPVAVMTLPRAITDRSSSSSS